jgi:hypothetical protein
LILSAIKKRGQCYQEWHRGTDPSAIWRAHPFS